MNKDELHADMHSIPSSPSAGARRFAVPANSPKSPMFRSPTWTKMYYNPEEIHYSSYSSPDLKSNKGGRKTSVKSATSGMSQYSGFTPRPNVIDMKNCKFALI